MSVAPDLTGIHFGRLVAEHRVESSKRGHARWFCSCICGGVTEAGAGDLQRGHTNSCGCLVDKAITTHGHSSRGIVSRTYYCWKGMKERCSNPNAKTWKYYGGRGIAVCDRWLNSFENFLANMGERPEGRTIDRRDNDGNYEPSNCRWATPKQQANNRRLPQRSVSQARAHA